MHAVIEAGIHVMRMQWDVDGALKDQVLLLVDEKNAFNLQNQVMMLWEVRHYWTSGTIFVLNVCRWSLTLKMLLNIILNDKFLNNLIIKYMIT